MFSSATTSRCRAKLFAACTSASASRTFVNRAAIRPVPPPTVSLATPTEFLRAIGRSSETKVKAGSWDEFWHTPGFKLREQGVNVKDRRYIMWCMDKFRKGIPVEEFAHEPKPKKTMRGWGPKIVDGKLNRSKRHRHK